MVTNKMLYEKLLNIERLLLGVPKFTRESSMRLRKSKEPICSINWSNNAYRLIMGWRFMPECEIGEDSELLQLIVDGSNLVFRFKNFVKGGAALIKFRQGKTLDLHIPNKISQGLKIAPGHYQVKVDSEKFIVMTDRKAEL